jgi:hypothetical protein
MYDKISKTDKFDIVKEIIWTLFLTAASFVYWVVLLLAITFVFNSIIKLTFEAVLLISVFLTAGMLLYRMVKGIMKLARG